MELLVQKSREAADAIEKEYNAAVKIQSWFRGCRVRAYLEHLRVAAIVIQRNYRGHVGRAEYRRKLKVILNKMRSDHYHKMAIKIQRCWRAYFVRRYVFDYYAYRRFLLGLMIKNEQVRTSLEEEWKLKEDQRTKRECITREMQAQDHAKRHHYLLGTATRDGIFKKLDDKSPHPLEDRMRSIKFAPPLGYRIRSHSKSVTSEPSHLTSSRDEETKEKATEGFLPPLVRLQGPFKSPEKVRELKIKSLCPTLRVATKYDSAEVARSKVKAEDWAKRINDIDFKRFPRRRRTYDPLLHTSSPYGKTPHGSKHFRDYTPSKHISNNSFKTVIPSAPTFESISSSF